MDEMTVRTPQGDTHTDQNDQEYGEVIEQLRTAVVTCMDSLFEEFDSGNMTDVKKQFAIITAHVDRLNLINHEIYVDRQALKWWLTNYRGDMAVYSSVRDHVTAMFQQLTDKKVLLTWIAELHQVLS